MLSLLQLPLSLGPIMLALLPVSLPFCVLQLALCRFCKNQYLRLAPAALGGGLFLFSFCSFTVGRGYDALFGILLIVPALVLLSGSGLGLAIWYFAEKYLH